MLTSAALSVSCSCASSEDITSASSSASSISSCLGARESSHAALRGLRDLAFVDASGGISGFSEEEEVCVGVVWQLRVEVEKAARRKALDDLLRMFEERLGRVPEIDCTRCAHRRLLDVKNERRGCKRATDMSDQC